MLLSWRQKVLARQVEYGAKLGHVVLSLATMELRNFYRSVMPVADYLDQRGQLLVVWSKHFFFILRKLCAIIQIWNDFNITSTAHNRLFQKK